MVTGSYLFRQRLTENNKCWGEYREIKASEKSKVLQKYLCIYVHSSIIQPNQRVKATQVSTDRRMGKQNVVHSYNRILQALKGKGILTHAITQINSELHWRSNSETGSTTVVTRS